MWVLDYLEDIESDLSVFHRVEDWRQLDSPRFFRYAERLVHYDGALKAALLAREPEGPPAVVERSPEQLAQMTEGPGAFPGIEYAG